MRINQLPDLPSNAQGAQIPCTYNGADYKTPLAGGGSGMDGYVYNSGTRVNGTFYGFGYVTSSSTQVTMIFSMPKTFYKGASITPTYISASIRDIHGGYIGNRISANLTSIYNSSTCDGYILTLLLKGSQPLEYGEDGVRKGTCTNNTPVTGYCYLEFNVN